MHKNSVSVRLKKKYENTAKCSMLLIKWISIIYILHFYSDDCSYSSIQEEMIRCFEYIKTFINDDNFVRHVRQNSNNLNDIEEKLDQNILDLKRTDGAIVFAGKIVTFCIDVNNQNRKALSNILSLIYLYR